MRLETELAQCRREPADSSRDAACFAVYVRTFERQYVNLQHRSH